MEGNGTERARYWDCMGACMREVRKEDVPVE